MLTDWPYPFWIAHRGAGKLAPENTLAAFRLGAQHGYRMFECDAKLSADGVPFLLHDSTLERTTSGHGTAGEQPWSALAQLDAGSWHSRGYAGEPIPTLENLARWCLANRLLLDIEIKPTPGVEERTGAVVAALAARQWQAAPVPPLLTSFRPEALLGALKAAPQLPRGLLLDTLWDAALVARVHGMGLRALSYTVNDEWAAERLIALGTDGVVTDRVDFFVPGNGYQK